MISVSQIAKQIIEQSPFLEEALYDNLINISSLARHIKPKIEEKLGKTTSDASIIMAINRMTITKKHQLTKYINSYLKKIGDLTIRNNIHVYTYRNSPKLSRLQSTLMEAGERKTEAVCTFTQGIAERTVIINESLREILRTIFLNEELIAKKEDLSAITLGLPQDKPNHAGVYYYILKQLAWQNISIVEIISTTNELTIVIENTDVQSAFNILMNLKRK